jgi:glycosyltransferase involved in cell wall biosynthesis
MPSTLPRSTSTDLYPLVDVVVPVYNEESQLESSIKTLREFLDLEFPFSALVTIVDNGSSDSTPSIATRLASEMSGVRAIHLADKGRGRALRAAWSLNEASVVAYTDVDLSTSLDALLPLVAPLLSGHSDIAIGSRLAPGARVIRGAKRELISRSYNLFLRAALHNGFSDAQCGFKAIRSDVARRLLPLVDDESWFFDTELLVVAERSGLRIHEVAVDWIDDPDSRVNIIATARADLCGVARLLMSRRTDPGSQSSEKRRQRRSRLENALRFARIGTVSTVVYAVLFLILRGHFGTYGANTLALVVCTVANIMAHEALVARRPGAGFSQPASIIGGVTGLATSLSLTSVAILFAGWISRNSLLIVFVALMIATACAALIRFALLSSLEFRASRQERVEER